MIVNRFFLCGVLMYISSLLFYFGGAVDLSNQYITPLAIMFAGFSLIDSQIQPEVNK